MQTGGRRPFCVRMQLQWVTPSAVGETKELQDSAIYGRSCNRRIQTFFFVSLLRARFLEQELSELLQLSLSSLSVPG